MTESCSNLKIEKQKLADNIFVVNKKCATSESDCPFDGDTEKCTNSMLKSEIAFAEEVKELFQTIIDIGYDYDGCDGSIDALKGLVDELVEFARDGRAISQQRIDQESFLRKFSKNT